MSNYMATDDIYNVGTLDASGANTVVYAPGRPVDVNRIVLVTTVAQTTADATLSIAVRDVDDGNSVAVGTVVVPFTGSAVNDVQYVNLEYPSETETAGADGSKVFKGYDPGGFVRVNPGQELSITSDGGGDAGTYQVYVEYKDLGFSGEGVVDAVELTLVSA